MFTFLKDYLHMKQGKWANQHIHVRLQVKVIKHRKNSAQGSLSQAILANSETLKFLMNQTHNFLITCTVPSTCCPLEFVLSLRTRWIHLDGETLSLDLILSLSTAWG